MRINDFVQLQVGRDLFAVSIDCFKTNGLDLFWHFVGMLNIEPNRIFLKAILTRKGFFSITTELVQASRQCFTIALACHRLNLICIKTCVYFFLFGYISFAASVYCFQMQLPSWSKLHFLVSARLLFRYVYVSRNNLVFSLD